MYGIFKNGKKEKSFETEDEFWNNFIDKNSLKYKTFFEMDKISIYSYINSIEE